MSSVNLSYWKYLSPVADPNGLSPNNCSHYPYTIMTSILPAYFSIEKGVCCLHRRVGERRNCWGRIYKLYLQVLFASCRWTNHWLIGHCPYWNAFRIYMLQITMCKSVIAHTDIIMLIFYWELHPVAKIYGQAPLCPVSTVMIYWMREQVKKKNHIDTLFKTE